MATRMLPARPTASAVIASSRMGVLSWSFWAMKVVYWPASRATMIASSGTPVDSTQVSTWRWMTPGARKFSGTPSRSAATATGRSTRSDCR